MRSTIWCVVCSACLTLLASPDSAGGGLGRARVVSRRRMLFSFFGQNNCSDPYRVSIRIYVSICIKSDITKIVM